jgi:hypothetical protein
VLFPIIRESRSIILLFTRSSVDYLSKHFDKGDIQGLFE